MGHEYHTIENAMYRHKTDIREALSYDSKHEAKAETNLPSKLVWLYPPDRPPHDLWRYRRQVASEEGLPAEMWLRVHPDGGGGRYRTYSAPPDVAEKLREWASGFDTVQTPGRQVYPTGDFYVIVQLDGNGRYDGLRTVGDVRIH